MTIRPISILPASILRQKAAPVAVVDDAVRAILDDMVATMRAADGLGLAAPQIGEGRRIIVMQCSEEKASANTSYTPAFASTDSAMPAPTESPADARPAKLWKMINPRLIAQSEDTVTWEEGCLSIPDVRGEVTRPASVRVAYWDEYGNEAEMEARGLLAICVQHEIDHLNGRLFIDYLSAAKRDMITRKFAKAARHKPGHAHSAA